MLSWVIHMIIVPKRRLNLDFVDLNVATHSWRTNSVWIVWCVLHVLHLWVILGTELISQVSGSLLVLISIIISNLSATSTISGVRFFVKFDLEATFQSKFGSWLTSLEFLEFGVSLEILLLIVTLTTNTTERLELWKGFGLSVIIIFFSNKLIQKFLLFLFLSTGISNNIKWILENHNFGVLSESEVAISARSDIASSRIFLNTASFGNFASIIHNFEFTWKHESTVVESILNSILTNQFKILSSFQFNEVVLFQKTVLNQLSFTILSIANFLTSIGIMFCQSGNGLFVQVDSEFTVVILIIVHDFSHYIQWEKSQHSIHIVSDFHLNHSFGIIVRIENKGSCVDNHSVLTPFSIRKWHSWIIWELLLSQNIGLLFSKFFCITTFNGTFLNKVQSFNWITNFLDNHILFRLISWNSERFGSQIFDVFAVKRCENGKVKKQSKVSIQIGLSVAKELRISSINLFINLSIITIDVFLLHFEIPFQVIHFTLRQNVWMVLQIFVKSNHDFSGRSLDLDSFDDCFVAFSQERHMDLSLGFVFFDFGSHTFDIIFEN